VHFALLGVLGWPGTVRPAACLAAEPEEQAAAAAEQLEPPPPASAEDEEARERAAVEKVRKRAVELFYVAKFTFKDLQPTQVREISQHFGYGRANDLATSLSLDKRVLHLDAVLVEPAEGLLVMPDPNVNFGALAAMELDGKDGKTYPLTRVALGRNSAAVVLRAEGFTADVPAPVFRDDVIEDGARIMIALATEHAGYRDVLVQEACLDRILSHADDLLILQLPGLPGGLRPNWPVVNRLMFDQEGDFVGIAVSGMLLRLGTEANYITRWPQSADWLSDDELRQAEQRAVEQAMAHTRRVRFQFRTRGAGRERTPAAGNQWFAYGLTVGEDLVFIPSEIEQNRIETIESLKIRLASGMEVPATFVGLYKEFGGMLVRSLVRLEPPPELWRERTFADTELFTDMSVKQRFGRKDALVKYNRFFGTTKGYKDKEFRNPIRPVLPGSLLLDGQGRFYGFATNEKRYESALRSRGGERGDTIVRCYLFADMKDRFLNPSGYFDPRAKVKDIQERKELAWLGVEFQPVTPRLARELKIEPETRDGQDGLLVTLVYDASPAQRMGLRPGDVMLRLQIPGRAGEIPLRLAPTYDRSRIMADAGSSGAAPYVQREWFNRVNPITNLLTSYIGVGQQAVLTFSQDHQIRSAPFTVEKAPPDLRSAEKYKNERTGLTVKDITYEVRHVLRLDEGFEGVIVYEVEGGSPAAVGRITPMEFILEADGRKVTSGAEFDALLEQLEAAETGSVPLKVHSLDESRFVQLQLDRPPEPEP
jgi:hypothetical protein